MPALATETMFSSWSFSGQWRRYQRLALDAFERDFQGGHFNTLLVAPPGSGKTLLGLEIIRRVGKPALVLSPTQPILNQWTERQEDFGGVNDNVHTLTYQALCQTANPSNMLKRAAESRWAKERAKATGETPAQARRTGEKWTGAAAKRRKREIARIVASLKRQALTKGLDDVDAIDLIAPAALARIRSLKSEGVSTVVLDECHHLTGLWGAVLAILLRELGDVHIVGLTATTPETMTEKEALVYKRLFGEIDFQVPTPAVVREGHLSPYQELVQLCEPLQSEREWLAEHHVRFDELLDELDRPPNNLRLTVWLLMRLRERSNTNGSQMTWSQFSRRNGRLAESGLRWLHHIGEEFPEGAPRGEAYRAGMDIEDWIVLLNDYALGCLQASGAQKATTRLSNMQVALSDLGYLVTRRGIRASASEVDNVLLNSAAKPLAACDILDTEYRSRMDSLRTLILTDSQHGPKQPADSPLMLAGGGRGVLSAISNDARLHDMQGVLITAESFVVIAKDADWWEDRIVLAAQGEGISLDKNEFVRVADGYLIELNHKHSAFSSRHWTAWVTEMMNKGELDFIVGTRGLLGEGWDCPAINVLIDMTAVAADVSVRQMRGRSLRRDPNDVNKVACNWDVVCVAPELARGHADYSRFVRRHKHIHAPCEDGVIETGPSHVHPSLSPYNPPAASEFKSINQEQQERARQLNAARDRWAVGTPYRAVELRVLVIRRNDNENKPAKSLHQHENFEPINRHQWEKGKYASALTKARPRRKLLFPSELPLDWAIGMVCESYIELGELAQASYDTLQLSPRPDGWLRVSLPDASEKEAVLVMDALNELLEDNPLPKYMLSRQACIKESVFATIVEKWQAMPGDFARRKDRAQVFQKAWLRWCGPSEMRLLGDGEIAWEGSDLNWTTTARQVWQ